MMFAKNLTLILTAIVAFAVLGTSSGAAPAKTGRGVSSPRTFHVSGRAFTGTAKTICVIEGKWADGEVFRFDAWDGCADMSMRRATKAEFKGAPSLGSRDDYEVADIPDGSEVIQINNDYSSVLLFRDRKGEMREIMVGD